VFSTLCESSVSMRHLDVSELIRNPKSGGESGVFCTSFGVSGCFGENGGEHISASFGKIGEIKVVRSEQGMEAVGSINMSAVTEKDGIYGSAEGVIPFRVPLDLPVPESEGVECAASAGISNLSCRMTENGVETEAELTVCVHICGITGAEIVYEVQLDTAKPHENRRSQLTICYCEPGTRVFDIAKRYKVSPETIRETNSVGETASGAIMII